jgi:hypothetical protein
VAQSELVEDEKPRPPRGAAGPSRRTATDEGTLLVNLEAIGLLALEGERERVVGVLRRMAFELGAAPLVGTLHLILVGLPEVRGLEDHVDTAATLQNALDRSTRLVGHRREELAAAGAPSAAAARSAGMAGDTWPPVVILAAGAEQEELRRAAEATTDPASNGVVVVVVANHTGARWALDLDDDQVYVGPLGFSVDPQPGTTNSPTRLLGCSPGRGNRHYRSAGDRPS